MGLFTGLTRRPLRNYNGHGYRDVAVLTAAAPLSFKIHGVVALILFCLWPFMHLVNG